MTSRKSYSRYFIILQEEQKGYGLDNDKAPSGYAKLEVKNNKSKISYYVQNLKKDKGQYNMILITDKQDPRSLINVGKLNIDDNGKADVSFEYDMNNIAGTNIAMDKIVGAAIVTMNGKMTPIMVGFSTNDVPKDWMTYPIAKATQQPATGTTAPGTGATGPSMGAAGGTGATGTAPKPSTTTPSTGMTGPSMGATGGTGATGTVPKPSTTTPGTGMTGPSMGVTGGTGATGTAPKPSTTTPGTGMTGPSMGATGGTGMTGTVPKPSITIPGTGSGPGAGATGTGVTGTIPGPIPTTGVPGSTMGATGPTGTMQPGMGMTGGTGPGMGVTGATGATGAGNVPSFDEFDEEFDEFDIIDAIPTQEQSTPSTTRDMFDRYEEEIEFSKMERHKHKKCKDHDHEDEYCGHYKEDKHHHDKYDMGHKDYMNEMEHMGHKDHMKNHDWPTGKMGEFFKNVVKGFEKIGENENIKNCFWYKAKVDKLEDMYCIYDYNKYTVAFYPMICYYPYISKHKSFMIGYKCDDDGKLKYIIYAIPGTKAIDDQPYGGKTGFVTWMPSEGNKEMGHWLMYYDFKTNNVVIPIKRS